MVNYLPKKQMGTALHFQTVFLVLFLYTSSSLLHIFYVKIKDLGGAVRKSLQYSYALGRLFEGDLKKIVFRKCKMFNGGS